MPFATSTDGCRIAYDIHGDGEDVVVLLLRHLPWNDWGYVEQLAKDRRVLIVDPRGHGESTHPDPVSYGLWKTCDDILAAADHAGVDTFGAFGYSNTALRLTALATTTSRVKSLICGGYALLGFGEQHRYIDFARSQHEDGKKGEYLDGATFDWGESVALLEEAERWDVEQALAGLTCPRLLYFGSDDFFAADIRKSQGRLEKLGWVVREIEGLDHETGASRSDLVVPMLREFL